jgi:hypothetical protein
MRDKWGDYEGLTRLSFHPWISFYEITPVYIIPSYFFTPLHAFLRIFQHNLDLNY